MADTTRGARRPSGRFLVRIDPSLHAELRDAAEGAGVSLNELCARRLSAPVGDEGGPGRSVVARAASLIGGALAGVVAFGSWARDELTTGSDVDVLVVVDDHVPIRRDLYRLWDRDSITWEGRPVDAHFAHLPNVEERVASLWLDVAVDGAVLYDRDLDLSRRLVALRTCVASGRFVRHYAHGQAYWVEAA